MLHPILDDCQTLQITTKFVANMHFPSSPRTLAFQRSSLVPMALASLMLQLGSWIHALVLLHLPSWILQRRKLAPGFDLQTTTQEFLHSVESQLLDPFLGDGLLQLSRDLKTQLKQRLQDDPACMLPSYSTTLPTGQEEGQYLALDVGGSTLRVALVSLGGSRDAEIISFKSYKITQDVKDLIGHCFFDWMASRIVGTLDESGRQDSHEVVPLALAWSFPIDQTSLKSGRIHPMGKGFRASDGLVGSDLAQVIESACQRAGLSAQLGVILNDGSATLLSSAYTHESTRFGLILGTGLNVAAYLPVSLVGQSKLEGRSEGWLAGSSEVIVNNEAGMFGHEILPATVWDEELRRDLGLDLQPLEYMTSGMYLGEIARRIMAEGVVSHGLLGGVVPPSLLEVYSLSTATMALVESDVDPALDMARKAFAAAHPSQHETTLGDAEAMRQLFAALSRRSAALVAAYVHAAWELRREDLSNEPMSAHRAEELAMTTTTVAFSGSVIENYPGYHTTCQGYLDALVHRSWSHEKPVPEIRLVPAKESALIGAGVGFASQGTATCQ